MKVMLKIDAVMSILMIMMMTMVVIMLLMIASDYTDDYDNNTYRNPDKTLWLT